MAGQVDRRCWMLTLDAPGDGATDLLQRQVVGDACDGLWQSLDGTLLRAYAVAALRPGTAWQQLHMVQELVGASAGQAATFHYVVETDMPPEHAQQLTDWYAQEHLPGLAAVPGAVRAARYLCLDGVVPRSFACYDLTTPDALQSAAWLAVRHTAWSSRVRPLFRNPMRTMFRRATAAVEPSRSESPD
ncbi:hypothetical protein O4H66_24105 [Comamonadaceae bacterium G21597-S1]|nr:hypothetical protein [Comamonadaceae bacterium G21597-S1]